MLSITVLNRWLQRTYGHLFEKSELQHGFRSRTAKERKSSATAFSYKNEGACQKDLPKLSISQQYQDQDSRIKDDRDCDAKILFIFNLKILI
jgi:hypothetical protein